MEIETYILTFGLIATLASLIALLSSSLYKWLFKKPREVLRYAEQLEMHKKNQDASITEQQIELNVRDKMIKDLIDKEKTSINQVNDLSKDSTAMLLAVMANKNRISEVNEMLNSFTKHLLANEETVRKQLEEQREMLQKSFAQISQLLKHINKKRQ